MTANLIFIIDIPEILLNFLLFLDKVIPECGKTGYPLLFYYMIFASETPGYFFFFVFGRKTRILNQSFTNVLSLHHEHLIEYDLKRA